MATLPKWTEERTAQLAAFVGDESPVSQATVAEAASTMETTVRSIASKLRKMGFPVELVASTAVRAYSEAQSSALESLVVNNSGVYTYAEIAEIFEGGAFSAKSVQGKILSMELTSHIKNAEKPVSTKTYTDQEAETFVSMVNAGAFVEAIAEALSRDVKSIRGKALSLLRAGAIEAMPRQEHVKDSAKDDVLSSVTNLAEMTVEEIAEMVGKSARGIKTMLTRRGLTASDYDGAAKKEKAAS